MERTPPSQRICQRINDLLHHGIGEADGREISTTAIGLGVERLIQEMLEEEVKDCPGRGTNRSFVRYLRREPDQEHRGHRNGYEPGRVRTLDVLCPPRPRCRCNTSRELGPVSIRGAQESTSHCPRGSRRCQTGDCLWQGLRI